MSHCRDQEAEQKKRVKKEQILNFKTESRWDQCLTNEGQEQLCSKTGRFFFFGVLHCFQYGIMHHRGATNVFSDSHIRRSPLESEAKSWLTTTASTPDLAEHFHASCLL